MNNKKSRFDCLKESSEKEDVNMFKNDSDKNSKGGRFCFEKEDSERNNFRDDERNNFRDDGRNNFRDDGRNNFRDDGRNNFSGGRMKIKDTFDEDRGGTYGRARGTNKYYGQNFNNRDTYNSFNRKRKEESIKKEKPKKEFSMTETDFPSL